MTLYRLLTQAKLTRLLLLLIHRNLYPQGLSVNAGHHKERWWSEG